MNAKSIWFSLLLLGFIIMTKAPGYSQRGTEKKEVPEQVTKNIFLIKDYGCNIVLMVGPDGLLMIDSGYKETGAELDSLTRTVSTLKFQYLLNTHFHFDHLGGNKVFVDKGAKVVSNLATRKHMQVMWDIPTIADVKYPTILPYEDPYLPTICFSDSMILFFNDEQIRAIEYKDAHTEGDVIYFFQQANVIHAGDLFLSNGFPVIDIYDGGSIDGYIYAVEKVIGLCNEKTIIIPGHGPIANLQDLRDYCDMLIASRDRILELIKEGKTVNEVINLDPTKGLFKKGESWLPPKLFVFTVYQELSQK
jgi:cyclase